MHLRCHDPPLRWSLDSTAGGPLVAGPAVGRGSVECCRVLRRPGPGVSLGCGSGHMPASRSRTRSNPPEGPCKPVSKVVMVAPCPAAYLAAVGVRTPWRGASPRRGATNGLPVQLEGAAEARTDLLLDGDVEKADLLKHPGPLEGPHVDGPHPSGFDQRSDLGLGLSGVARH